MKNFTLFSVASLSASHRQFHDGDTENANKSMCIRIIAIALHCIRINNGLEIILHFKSISLA